MNTTPRRSQGTGLLALRCPQLPHHSDSGLQLVLEAQLWPREVEEPVLDHRAAEQ